MQSGISGLKIYNLNPILRLLNKTRDSKSTSFMNFRKVNNITGWAVFLVALATYMLTREATR